MFDPEGDSKTSGVLLHTKFLPNVGAKSQEELARKQHFESSEIYENYHQQLIENPTLWHQGSKPYVGEADLVAQLLMSKGSWA